MYLVVFYKNIILSLHLSRGLSLLSVTRFKQIFVKSRLQVRYRRNSIQLFNVQLKLVKHFTEGLWFGSWQERREVVSLTKGKKIVPFGTIEAKCCWCLREHCNVLHRAEVLQSALIMMDGLILYYVTLPISIKQVFISYKGKLLQFITSYLV